MTNPGGTDGDHLDQPGGTDALGGGADPRRRRARTGIPVPPQPDLGDTSVHLPRVTPSAPPRTAAEPPAPRTAPEPPGPRTAPEPPAPRTAPEPPAPRTVPQPPAYGAHTAYQPLSGRPVDPRELADQVAGGFAGNDDATRIQPAVRDQVPDLDRIAAQDGPQVPAAAAAAAAIAHSTPGGRHSDDGPTAGGPGGGGPGGPDGPDDGDGGGPGDGDDGAGGHVPPWRRAGAVRIVRRVFVGGVAAAALILVLAVIAFAIGYVRADVPEPGALRTNQVATIFDKDGKTVLARVIPPEGNRTDIAPDQIPQSMKDAVMAAEDRSFMTNPGFSVTGFARAAWDRVPGVGGSDDAGGGSTITQQYVKNALVGDEHSLTRKWRELIISTKMSRSWSKDEIMAAYLNTIYFGRNAYGLEAAARAYFNIPAKNLTVSQSALLAAVVRSPSYYDPAVTPDAALSRWNWVLDGMVSMGTLQKDTRDGEKFPRTIAPGSLMQADDLSNGPNGLIKNQVLQELKDAGISEQDLNTQGLQITTTIDPQAQAAAVKAAHSDLQGEPKKLRTAVVSVDPKTGGISAYYGGDDGNGYDRVQAGLQTGSSFKVFALLAALQQGIPLSRVYSSAPLQATGVRVTNSDGESCGSCNLATALKMSLNTVYYRLMLDLNGQAQAVADMAHKAGVAESFGNIAHTLQQPDGSVQGGVVLGQYLVRPLDMASAYATIAASGIYRKPHLIEKVVAADGRVLLDRGTDPGQRVFSADVANNTTAAMVPIAGYSNGHNLADGRLSAAKTGTAQYKDTGQNKDAWMVGFTPSLSTAVWVGADDGSAITNEWGGIIYGSQIPSDIWKDTMDGALAGTDDETFPTPGEIGGQAGIPVETTTSSASRDRSFGRYPSGDGSSSDADSGDGSTSATRTIPGLPGVPFPTFPGFTPPGSTDGQGDGNGDGYTTTVPRPRRGTGTNGYGGATGGYGGGTGAGGQYTRVVPTPP